MASAPRRSTRPRNQATRNAPPAPATQVDVVSVTVGPKTDEEVVAQDDEEVAFEEPEKNTKKRKAPQPKKNASVKKKAAMSASGSGQPPAKKARAIDTSNVLKLIMKMPFDISYEIFTCLEPMDLINLGRSSKDLKELVLSSDFKMIWRHTLSVLGLPPCPEDMLLPAYADLAFGKNCWLCSSTTLVTFLWGDRKKLCHQCHSRQPYIETKHYDQLPESLTGQRFFYSLRYGVKASGYIAQVVLRLGDEYRSLKTEDEKQEWENVTASKLKALTEHAARCRDWRTWWEKECTRREQAMFQDQKERVVQMLKDLGWEEELALMSHRRLVQPQQREDILKICRKRFTDDIIENLKVMLNDIMTRTKEDRIDGKNEKILRIRLGIVNTAYNNALASWYSPFESRPRGCDIMQIPRFRQLVRDIENRPTITAADFGFQKDTLPEIIKEAQAIINDKLLQIVASGYGKKKSYDPTTVLSLATTLFNNEDIGYKRMQPRDRTQANACSFLTVPQVMTCATSGAVPADPLSVFDQLVVETSADRARPWNSASRLSFNKHAHDAACGVLNICNLDPEQTTLEEVENADPILECEACNSFTKGRLILSWDGAVAHALAVHKGKVDSKTVRLIRGKDADEARGVMATNKRRRQYTYANAKVVCLHCNVIMNVVENMLKHIYETHDVKFTGDEDMAFAYMNYISYLDLIGREDGEYRLWPPRNPGVV
ncbi:hypothetical protein CVT24_005224 [Panaeolus cyanescens]|uniref:F-box domain-containing protein n=1 Tax=Panaeolus cyanescens TaxID=181874 RepID=A0A409Y986_9AGAR|nr:hypothetical protein CVT24_005224 [Panaeolus cyanescens]